MSPSTATPAPSRPATGVLLAGGASRRMGVDKRLLVLGGRTLLVRGVRFLETLFPSVVVSVAPGPAPDLGDAAGDAVVADAYEGASPMVGIVTVLERLQRPAFFMAVDVAFPDPFAARRVLEACSADVDVCLPVVDGLLEPLFAVYGPGCVPAMRDMLAHGKHKILDAFPQLRVRTVPFASADRFLNINDGSGLETARRRLAELRQPQPRQALVAIVGKSNSGKTTLIERLLPELLRLGVRVGTVKHDAHSFEIDHPGKDSYRHGAAGAEAYVVSSPQRVAYVGKLAEELTLQGIVGRYFTALDLIVAEGYKRTSPNRIEIFRQAAGYEEPLCAPGESLAVVTDAPLPHPVRLPLDDPVALAGFIALRLDTLRRY
jgi:molybdopterin-guanine dinucleotide biosynthesis protein